MKTKLMEPKIGGVMEKHKDFFRKLELIVHNKSVVDSES